MAESSLGKVLRVAGAVEEKPAEPDLRELISAACSELHEAVRVADPAVAAQLVLAALADLDGAAGQLFIEMTGPVPEGVLAFAAMTTEARKKPSAHTIPGSTDFPIPDKHHLSLAVGRYHAGDLAGHSKEEVASHIRGRARALGETVDLATALVDTPVLLELARGAAAVVPMTIMASEHHEPMHGTHAHAHTHSGDSSHGMEPGAYALAAPQQRGAGIVNQDENKATWGRLNMEQAASEMSAQPHAGMTGTHSHSHTHLGDNSHGGRSDSSVAMKAAEAAWAQKGAAAWAHHRRTWGQDAAADKASGQSSGVQRGPGGEAVGHREVTRG